MSLLSNLKSLFKGSGRVDISQRFELLKEAISGTMSKFYMARDRKDDRIVGLKILDAEKTAALEQRFRGLKKPSEGEIALKLVHTRGEQFLVMEYLNGPGLNSMLVAKSPLLNGRRVTILRQTAEALAEIHRLGYIHRDICPRNIVVDRACETVKLIDFGLTVPDTPPFRQPGIRTGTPNYMAPEVVRRRSTSKLIDVFSFGVTAYEICTNDLPWPRGATGMDAMKHGIMEPNDIRKFRPGINETLARAIHECLDPNAHSRLDSLVQFLTLIEGIEHEDAN
jgi:eukaryotic-like serine/threonine-protein kinase